MHLSAWSPVQALLDSIAPRECFSCGTRGAWLCEACTISTPRLTTIACPACGTPVRRGSLQDACRNHLALDYLIPAVPLKNKAVQSLIYGVKYHGLRSAAACLARLCDKPLSETPSFLTMDRARTLCVPIPLFRQKENYRGFNQAALLAQEIANSQHIAYAELLECIRPARDQIGLTRPERRINLQGIFSVADKLDTRISTVVLVDDVVTSGATLQTAAVTLRKTADHPLTIIGVAAAYNNSFN